MTQPTPLQRWCALLTLAACEPAGDSGNPAPEQGGDWTISDPVECEGGTSGPDRFSDQTAALGLDVAMTSFWGKPTTFGANVIVFDLDHDGDDDVLLGRNEGPPHLLENTGGGVFSELAPPFADFIYEDGPVAGLAVADIDGDFLPEMFLGGTGRVQIARNLGGLSFAPPEMIYEDSGEMVPYYISMSLADIDADGDLDLGLPSLDYVPRSIETAYDENYFGRGTYDLVLRNEGDLSFTPAAQLSPDGTPGYALAAIFTDYDNDLDPDLFVSTARIDLQGEIPAQALYRNDGNDAWTNVAHDVYVDWELSGMGYDANDANGDGLLDHCFSDTGPVRCFVSYPDGGYVESGTTWGLVPPETEGSTWSGWSVEWTDLDNDGVLDMWVAAGNEVHPRQVWGPWVGDHPQRDYDIHADEVFWGNGDGSFRAVAAEFGLDDAADHYGLVASDLNGDGSLEVLTTGSDGTPRAWGNSCTSGGWVEVSLVGPPENTAGLGARIEVDYGDRSESREMHGVRGFGQAPPRWHFGLGSAAELPTLTLTWPDGEKTTIADIPARTRVVVSHPRAER